MMDVMPRPRWPHLFREVSRHGTVRWVVRVGHGPRTPIAADYGSPEFEADHAAIRGDAPAAARKAATGTLQWLWDRYRASSAWGALKPATRRQRKNIMGRVLLKAGAMPAFGADQGRRHRRPREPSQDAEPGEQFPQHDAQPFAWAVENAFLRPTRARA